MPGSSEPSPSAPWKEGDPRADKPLPAVTLAKISASSSLFLRMGAGWPQAECTLPTLPGAVLGRVGTSHILPSDEHSRGSSSQPRTPLIPVRTGQELGTPWPSIRVSSRNWRKRKLGEGLGVSFLSFFLLPHPQHTHQCGPTDFLPSFRSHCHSQCSEAQGPRWSPSPGLQPSPAPTGGGAVHPFLS